MVVRHMTISTRAPFSLPYRTFSTSLARLETSRSRDSNASSAPPAVSRRNPLIGNLSPAPPPPAAARDTPQAPAAVQASTPPQTPSISPNSSSTAPPPPPPASTTAPTPEIISNKDQSHPYTAASSANPINIDLASIIASRASTYAANLGPNASTDPQRLPQIRSDAAKGRTVFISADRKPGTVPNVQAAMRQLNRINREDFVKQKYNSQREHERKGLKRKRLRSERWKARFKMGFKAAAERVLYLKKQGW